MKTNKLKIMNRFLFVGLIALLTACSATSNDEKKEKEEELKTYKKELNDLKKKIAKLEEELSVGADDAAVSVVASPIEYRLYEHFVDVTGSVQADKNIIVSPESPGKIVSIDVKEGDKVKKGQILARLNTDMIERNLDEVKINLELATTTFERQTNLWKQNIGSEMEYLQAKSQKEGLEHKLEALEAQLDMAHVRAPINGIVDDIIQKQGEMAGPSMPFARLVNIDQVYITADISETYLQKIKAGDEVELSFPVLNTQINAKIFRTSSVIDPDSRTFRARINLNNKSGDIKPNMLAVLKLRTFTQENAIVVPSILVKKDFSGEFVFIATEKDGQMMAKKQYIKSGIKDNNNTLVTEGLNVSDQLITKGFAQVVDGSPISL